MSHSFEFIDHSNNEASFDVPNNIASYDPVFALNSSYDRFQPIISNEIDMMSTNEAAYTTAASTPERFEEHKE